MVGKMGEIDKNRDTFPFILDSMDRCQSPHIGGRPPPYLPAHPHPVPSRRDMAATKERWTAKDAYLMPISSANLVLTHPRIDAAICPLLSSLNPHSTRNLPTCPTKYLPTISHLGVEMSNILFCYTTATHSAQEMMLGPMPIDSDAPPTTEQHSKWLQGHRSESISRQAKKADDDKPRMPFQLKDRIPCTK